MSFDLCCFSEVFPINHEHGNVLQGACVCATSTYSGQKNYSTFKFALNLLILLTGGINFVQNVLQWGHLILHNYIHAYR